ncbi:MAG: right-handed parallel beta-helix repeat-containing protein [Holophaga sp.]|nr:right-handed parallel beta-helix repeat-containing protein [Holophaga sp.]
MDADAPNGGDGSQARPFNSFEVVCGWTGPSGTTGSGLLRGGDHLYLSGEFKASVQPDPAQFQTKNMTIILFANASGTPAQPTLITTWPGRPRAVLNGEHLLVDLIQLRRATGIRIDSLEVKNAASRGIQIAEYTAWAEVINCEVHHTTGNGIMGTGGGINFTLTSGTLGHDYTIRNCVFYANHQNQVGGDNNVGGISILSEGSARSGSIIRIFDNIVFDEKRAIRHKHSGNIRMEAHHNLIHSSLTGFYLRAFHDNQIHHNLVLDCTQAFLLEKENLQGDFSATIHHNTLVGCIGAVGYTHDSMPYPMRCGFTDNLFANSSATDVLVLGRWASSLYTLADWSSARNLYQHANAATFLWHQGVSRAFADAMTYLGDTTSRSIADPQFRNLTSRDYRLTATSPARGAGENGSDVGALPYNSSYVLDLTRYTVMPTGTLTITSPNGGEAWQRGESRPITWTSSGITGNVVIELVQNGTAVGIIAENVAATAGTFTWAVGRLANGAVITGTGCKIRIRATSGIVSANSAWPGQSIR